MIITFAILFSAVSGLMTVSAAEGNYAWVLVDTHEYPVPEADSFYGSLKGNTIELQYAWSYGLGVYASKDYDNPTDMHAVYTWSNPPSTIMPNETVTLNFIGEGRPGDKHALYVGVYAGSPGSVGVRYTYEWKQTSSANVTATVSTTTQVNPAGSNAETFESGSRIMWQPADGLGYRLFRSTSKSDLGISVTDFYITGTSYADVNVEANTTYYYTVKPVLAEAKPFEGIDEKLGAAIATYTVTTGSQKMDVAPVSKNGRTFVPVRFAAENLNCKVDWINSTKEAVIVYEE